MRAVQAPADNTKTKYWPLPVATPMGMPGIPTADDQGHRQWGPSQRRYRKEPKPVPTQRH